MRPSGLVRLYPRRWRRRYEEEFRALLDEETLSIRLILDVLAGALGAHLAPYPSEDPAVTGRRLQTAVSFLAVLLVLPSLVFLTSAAVRSMQPTDYEPAHTAATIFDWFASMRATGLLLTLIVGPLLALALSALALGRRLSTDEELRADLRLFGRVGLRLLRRPVLVAGAIAVVGSLAVLAFAVGHAIAG